MVAVFASTAGLSGAELVIAGGTTAGGQRLLEAVFGDAAVRQLATEARADLGRRAADLLVGEQARFTGLLAAAAPTAGSAEELRDAVRALATARGARA
jgi:hypothetical protein